MIKPTSRRVKHRQVRRWAEKKKEEIFKQANNQCQKCGTTKSLSIHHTKYEKGFENLQVLCNKCHRKYHIKETRKKILIMFIKKLNQFNDKMTIKELKEKLNKEIDSIGVEIVTPMFIDGL